MPQGTPLNYAPKKPAAASSTPAPKLSGKLGYKQEIGIEGNVNRRAEMLSQLMSMFGAYDALNTNLQARNDPTIPALLNSQLQSYANQMSGGAPNVNAMLGGDFSHSAQSVPVTLGAGNGSPFDLGIQKGGIDPGILEMFNSIIGPSNVGQINNAAQTLYEFGNPNGIFHTQGVPLGPNNVPLPLTQNPTYGQPMSQSTPPAMGAPMQFKPISSLPMPGPVAPASAPVQPPPAQQQGQPVPQYAQGTPYVPQTGVAVVHQGEQITPAAQNPNGNVYDSSHIQAYNQTPAPTPIPAPQGGLMPPPAPPPQAAVPPPPIPGGTPHTMPQQPPPPNYGGAANPLQQSINQLSQMLQSGGPYNQQFQNIQNQQIADQTGSAYQQQRADMLSRLGARGLGGSGLQYGLENDLFNGRQAAQTMAQNQMALNAASGNWNALQSGAGNLMGAGLGAGQFGLAQQAQQQQMQQSMFQMLMDSLMKTQVNPSQLFGSQVTISPSAA